MSRSAPASVLWRGFLVDTGSLSHHGLDPSHQSQGVPRDDSGERNLMDDVKSLAQSVNLVCCFIRRDR